MSREYEEALARIGTPKDRAACLIRSFGLDAPQYLIAFPNLEECLVGQFEIAEKRAREAALNEAIDECWRRETWHREKAAWTTSPSIRFELERRAEEAECCAQAISERAQEEKA